RRPGLPRRPGGAPRRHRAGAFADMTGMATTPAAPLPVARVTRARRPIRGAWLVMVAIVVVLAAMPFLGGAGVTSTLVNGFILLTMASMWNLLAGYAGLVSVGQQAFV